MVARRNPHWQTNPLKFYIFIAYFVTVRVLPKADYRGTGKENDNVAFFYGCEMNLVISAENMYKKHAGREWFKVGHQPSEEELSRLFSGVDRLISKFELNQ